MPDPNASSGTLIAAAFESAGYAAQGQVLSQLGSTLILLASLIFILTFIYSVLMVMIQGDVRPLRWLIVGPVFCLFLLHSTALAGGCDW